jgi:DNA polymerase III delta prime subunit
MQQVKCESFKMSDVSRALINENLARMGIDVDSSQATYLTTDVYRPYEPTGVIMQTADRQSLVHDFNLFTPSTLMMRKLNPLEPEPFPKNAIDVETMREKCPSITTIIEHICVNNETFERFIEWLAFIFRFRRKTMTAWLFHGVQGTGKGLLYNYILQDLFGKNNCIKLASVTNAKFIDGIDRSLLSLMDELNPKKMNSEKRAVFQESLKEWITEPDIRSERKFVSANTIEIPTNFILFSNTRTPIIIAPGDRRFSVAPAQPVKLNEVVSNTSILVKNIAMELEPFADYLCDIRIDAQRVITAYESSEKEEMIKRGLNSMESLIYSINTGCVDDIIRLLMGDYTIHFADTADVINTIIENKDKSSFDLELDNSSLSNIYSCMLGRSRSITIDQMRRRLELKGVHPTGLKLTMKCKASSITRDLIAALKDTYDKVTPVSSINSLTV